MSNYIGALSVQINSEFLKEFLQSKENNQAQETESSWSPATTEKTAKSASDERVALDSARKTVAEYFATSDNIPDVVEFQNDEILVASMLKPLKDNGL